MPISLSLRPDGLVQCFTGMTVFAAMFAPSLGLEDITLHIEALTKFTQQALNDSQAGIALLNTEMSLMRRAVLQNRMALDITASQGGTYTIIQTGCCAFIRDESSNVSSLLKHMKKQMDVLCESCTHLDLFGWLPFQYQFPFSIWIGIPISIIYWNPCTGHNIQTNCCFLYSVL